MKASKFTDAQKAFIVKQGNEGTTVAEICRNAMVNFRETDICYFAATCRVDDLCLLDSLRFLVMCPRVTFGLLYLMKLVFGQIKQTESNREGWSFGLSLRFGLLPISFRRLGVFPSQITIGVTEADIVFDLENVTMPDEDWAFDTSMQKNLEVAIERTAEAGKDSATEGTASREGEGSFAGEAHANPKFSLSAKLKQAQSEKTATTDKIKVQVLEKYTVSRSLLVASGGPSAPSWNVSSFFKDQVLRGTAVKTNYFARALPIGEGSKLSLKATIPEHALKIRDETGAFTHINRRILALARIRKELCREGIELHQVKIPNSRESEDESN